MKRTLIATAALFLWLGATCSSVMAAACPDFDSSGNPRWSSCTCPTNYNDPVTGWAVDPCNILKDLKTAHTRTTTTISHLEEIEKLLEEAYETLEKSENANEKLSKTKSTLKTVKDVSGLFIVFSFGRTIHNKLKKGYDIVSKFKGASDKMETVLKPVRSAIEKLKKNVVLLKNKLKTVKEKIEVVTTKSSEAAKKLQSLYAAYSAAYRCAAGTSPPPTSFRARFKEVSNAARGLRHVIGLYNTALKTFNDAYEKEHSMKKYLCQLVKLVASKSSSSKIQGVSCNISLPGIPLKDLFNLSIKTFDITNPLAGIAAQLRKILRFKIKISLLFETISFSLQGFIDFIVDEFGKYVNNLYDLLPWPLDDMLEEFEGMFEYLLKKLNINIPDLNIPTNWINWPSFDINANFKNPLDGLFKQVRLFFAQLELLLALNLPQLCADNVACLSGKGLYCRKSDDGKGVVPTKCPAGHYCKEGQKIPCPAGQYQKYAGKETCNLCPKGTYQTQKGQLSCLPCPIAQYQDEEGQPSCKGCPNGSYQDANGQEACKLCPRGHACNNYAMPLDVWMQISNLSSSQCVDATSSSSSITQLSTCPDYLTRKWKYESSTGRLRNEKHSKCLQPSGNNLQLATCSSSQQQKWDYLPNSGQLQNRSNKKYLGYQYSSTAGTNRPYLNATSYTGPKQKWVGQVCPEGQSCLDGAGSNPTACPIGSFQSQMGQLKCKACPKGYHCPRIGMAAALPCPKGTYQNEEGKTSCKSCPTGFGCSATGITSVARCPSGTTESGTGNQTYCRGVETTNASEDCTAGYYQKKNSSKTYCIGQPAGSICPKGTYQNETGKTSCKLCPAGQYQDKLGETSCKPCPVGTYQDQTGKSSCLPCSTATGTQTGQTSCPINWISIVNQPQGMCLDVEGTNGNSGDNVLLGVCDNEADDQQWKYNPTTKQVINKKQNKCLEANAARDVKLGNCTTSNAFQKWDYNATTGELKNQGKPSHPCLNPLGTDGADEANVRLYICDSKSDQKWYAARWFVRSCPTGHYCTSATPTKCPAGTYNPSTGSVSLEACIPCPKGSFCPLGSSSPEACPKGKYSETTGAASCTSCPAGTYNAQTGQTGRSDCIACPIGTYNASTGATSASACATCPAGKYCTYNPLSKNTWIEIRNGKLGHCLNPNYKDGAAGRNVLLLQCDSNDDQQWFFNATTGLIINKAKTDSGTVTTTSTCLDVDASNSDNVKLSVCSSTANSQKWSYNSLTGEIKNQNGKCLNVKGTSGASGVNINVYSCNGTLDQKWNGMPCPADQFCPTAGAVTATPCPVGTYNPNLGQSDASACQRCPAGTYNSNTGSTARSACTACAAGKYNPLNGQTSSSACKSCEKGHYCPSTGMAAGKPCPVGKYNANKGSTSSSSCTACAAGKYNPSQAATASSACLSCPPNSYQNQSGKGSCKACPLGRSSVGGATSCPWFATQYQIRKDMWIKIQNGGAAYCLNPVGTDGAKDRDVEIDTCSSEEDQLWFYNSLTKEIVNKKQGMCLNPVGTSGARNSNVELERCDGNDDQKWVFDATTGQIKNVKSGYCLNPVGTAGARNSSVQIDTCTVRGDQTWSDNIVAFAIINKKQGKYLNPLGSDGASNSAIELHHVSNNQDMRWIYNPITQEIRNAKSGLCLNPLGTDGASGQQVKLYSCSKNTDQKWTYNYATQQIKNVAGNTCLNPQDTDGAHGRSIDLHSCSSSQDDKKWSVGP